jgi:hypothetical protein
MPFILPIFGKNQVCCFVGKGKISNCDYYTLRKIK